MSTQLQDNITREQKYKYIRGIYIFTIFIMSLTGFAQMPIFKRYYIADIPGLGWLAKFYVTHYIHYIGAIFLFALFGYCVVGYFLVLRHVFRLTWPAYVRIILLACIAGTGIFRVLKNLPNVVFSPNFTMFIDISHLCFMMILLLASALFLILKIRWLEAK